MADWKILQGHCLDVLQTLPAESVHCVVTSPPYQLGASIVRCLTGGVGRRRAL